MFHSTSQKMMREPDTGSAYMVQFKTSADHHTLSDMHELVQNHEQELKAHAAVMKQAAERQNQLNARLEMLYDTRMVTRATGEQNMAELQAEHEKEQKLHEERIQRLLSHQGNLTEYGENLATAVESEKRHEEARSILAESERIAAAHKFNADAAEAEHRVNKARLIMPKKPTKANKVVVGDRSATVRNAVNKPLNPLAPSFLNPTQARRTPHQQSRL